MPTITLDLTEDQFVRYTAALAKTRTPDQLEDDLTEPLLDTISRVVFEAEVTQGDTPRSQWVFFPPAPATPEEAAERLRREVDLAVERTLDEFARTRRYKDVVNAIKYAGSSDPQFNLEGTYCKEMCAAYYRALIQIEADVLAGVRPLPASVEEVLAELPPLEWPELP